MPAPAPSASIETDAVPERRWLDERSWVELTPGFVSAAGVLYEHLVDTVDFHPTRVFRYDHWVPEPRLSSWFTPASSPHPVLVDAHRTLQHRYGVRFDGAALAWYRDGRDMVAFHRDRDLQWLDDTVIALVVLGERRPFAIRPRSNRYAHEAPGKGATVVLHPGHGDLLVMGGATQAGWEHSVPPVRGAVGGRVSVQWRWTARSGRQERGGSYRAPRRYGRS